MSQSAHSLLMVTEEQQDTDQSLSGLGANARSLMELSLCNPGSGELVYCVQC
uniref:Uncharacterized protein n=1 Tax=Anguilla anguilla TaxID=7936 RepID=A0A0E9QGG5_ANGAN